MDKTTATAVFERIEREIWIVTSAHAGRRGGLVATFVTPASIVRDLPRVVAGIAKTHETGTLIADSGAFALHLVDETQVDLVWRFGLQSSRNADKFANLPVAAAATGSPILRDSLAWLDCRVEREIDIGDRVIYLAEVVAAAILRQERPLNLQRLLKIAPPEQLELLRTQMDADAAKDAEKIARWRREQR